MVTVKPTPTGSEGKPTFTRPADRSLASFRRWLVGLGQALDPAFRDNMTEEQWREAWRKFWQASEKKEGRQR